MKASTSEQVDFLRAILSLEIKNGYVDRAVIGGVDNYIRKWTESNLAAVTNSSDRPIMQDLLLSRQTYASKSKQERLEWVAEVLRELDAYGSGNRRNPARKGVTSNVPAARPSVARPEAILDSTVTNIKGIGETIAKKLYKLGVQTVRDLLYFFPRRFMDFSQRRTIASLETGREQTIFANVWEAREKMFGRMKCTEAVLGDETGNIRAVWFNQPWIARQLHTNSRIAVSGRVSEFNFSKVFENPEWELIEDQELTHTGRLVPVYQLTQGLYPRQVRTLVRNALESYLPGLQDFLPEEVRRRAGLMDLGKAVAQAHYPVDYRSQSQARQRLAFDELFILQLGVLGRKRDWQEGQPGYDFKVNEHNLSAFIKALPFQLTAAQRWVSEEICNDLTRQVPMSRLLQGDVGSGKTVVATIALLVALENGYQGALMAPTEILAEQHFSTLYKLLSAITPECSSDGKIHVFRNTLYGNVSVALLTGSMSLREKAAVYEQMGGGGINIIVGTHALIQKGVNFAKLGLVVIDEQHRFGVLQRSALRQKGYNPHLLVMTATPIPRTLALTLFGDLDISTINEMPPGRHKIKTRWVQDSERERAYNFIRKQITEGRQAFIICPLIEESENIEVKAAVAEYERLGNDIFPDLRLGLLHGKMKPAEKETVMRSFQDGALDILVSTSVVEVGIDVANATIMLVEAADRFGLSQLHQFRGRVGRGDKQSYCLLLSENPSEYGQERLRAIEEISDGFLLAEKDLELRGPGEFFGTRQSGLPDLKMARLSDTQLLESARKEAKLIFQKDPNFKHFEHELLALEFNRVWHKTVENH